MNISVCSSCRVVCHGSRVAAPEACYLGILGDLRVVQVKGLEKDLQEGSQQVCLAELLQEATARPTATTELVARGSVAPRGSVGATAAVSLRMVSLVLQLR